MVLELVVPLLFGLAALGGVAVAAWGLSELRLAYRIYANEPVSVLETTRGGPVEVGGTVEPDREVLESPFTGTACVAYEYAVEEKRRKTHSTGNGSSTRTTWETIDSGRAAVPFRIDDGSGSALVDPDGADFRLSGEGAIRVRGGERPPEPIARFVRENEDVSDENRSIGIGPLEFATGRDRRYRERRLDVGETVHVLGVARFDTSAARESGQVNAVVGAADPPREAGLLGRLRHRLFGPPFLVSDASERRTALRVAARGLGALALGAALAGVAVLLFA